MNDVPKVTENEQQSGVKKWLTEIGQIGVAISQEGRIKPDPTKNTELAFWLRLDFVSRTGVPQGQEDEAYLSAVENLSSLMKRAIEMHQGNMQSPITQEEEF